MELQLYMVLIDGVGVAQNMTLEHAVLFTEALFNKYYNDKAMRVSIMRMDSEDETEED